MTRLSNTLLEESILKSPHFEYCIKRVLGHGAFGVTYLAETTVSSVVKVDGPLGEIEQTVESNVKVAIKEFFMHELCSRTEDGTITDSSSSSMVSDYRRRFRKEAENLSMMKHPGIVRVMDVFDQNNTTYYAMEYIEGVSLDDYIKQHVHLDEQEAVAILNETGEALAYMHKQRMLHLDMKPKNIMRRKDGKLFLIDFGLSKHYNENGEAESSTSIGLGTPGYAPIEQVVRQGSHIFPAYIDVYALGATLFKMLTGETPPPAAEIMNEGFPFEELESCGVSEEMMRIVATAMNSRRAERFQSVEDFLAAANNPQAFMGLAPADDDIIDVKEPAPSNPDDAEATVPPTVPIPPINPIPPSPSLDREGWGGSPPPIEDDAPTTLAGSGSPDASAGFNGSPSLDREGWGGSPPPIEDDSYEEPPSSNNLLRYIIIFLMAALLCILAVSAYKILGNKKTRRIHQTEEVQKPAKTEKADSIAAAGKKASDTNDQKSLDATSKKGKSKRHSNSTNLNGGW
ncbi:MAG: protein kinase [Prevotella sp.]|nr:protein kinase [Prevotella sp.]